jgi:hypothetical protein
MLHASLHTICFVFCYTSWCFYAFSGTNLLTRCHCASSLFFWCFCVSENLHRKYSRDWTKQKPNLLFFSKHHKVRRWDRGEPGARHTQRRRGPGSGRATRGWATLAHLLTLPFRLYIPLDGKNLRDGSLFHKTYCKPPPSLSRDWEDPGAHPGT